MFYGRLSKLFCSLSFIFLSLSRRRIAGNVRTTSERIGNAVGKLLVSAAPLTVRNSMGGSFIKALVNFYLSQCRFWKFLRRDLR